MKLILDTHVFLWWLDDPMRLSPAALSAIQEEENDVYISAAVVWEIMIKKALKKLTAPDDIANVISQNSFDPLAITIEQALAVETLPMHHRDPFDRILIAQALVEGMTLVHRDQEIANYAVAQMRA